ncbi:uncharacterized protein BCR38DRAFT_428209 [Pseudomassariella vexata]|uniref:Uncharacterized protein n=1 Tax=Pseudomassariella vexata TaxID=1141098 RepID=A0A1Y2E8C1_9PEZI|nr:uncharacterized protein BCR38DRAFT_428209 [Pseudomassariella vexata]ORY67808.1 hypothetical protein BCR38DRAFT_428209 [Pseudomassariella vexata]
MATNEKQEVLATVNGFLKSISKQKPHSPNILEYILPDSFAVLSHQDELIQCTLGELIPRLEGKFSKIIESGTTSAGESIPEPDPDIWVHERFAAVWNGFSIQVDGVEELHGASAFTLLRGDDGWKIAALADTQWKADKQDPPRLVKEATPELMAPVLDLVQLLNDEKWDEVMRPMLPGGGATYSRFPNTLLHMLWPEFYARMRVMLERAPGYVEQKLMDWEGRMIGDLGFVWTPFTVAMDGELRIRGFNIFTLLRKDGKWLISGVQDG